MLVILSTSLMTFSQQIILNDKGDTLICFSVNESKFLLKEYYRAKELDEVLKICETEKQISDTIIVRSLVIISDLKQVNANNQQIIKAKDYELEQANISIGIANKNVRKQKVYKWIAIGVGTTITGFSGYYILTH